MNLLTNVGTIVNQFLTSENLKTIRRMIIIGVCTMGIGVIMNQFLEKGIRLPILIKSIPNPFAAKIVSISQKDALAMLNAQSAVFVDVRSDYEYDMDHIDGAINIPVVDYISNPALVDKYDRDKSLTAILYGADELEDNIPLLGRSLLKKSVADVKSLEGGFEQWLENDYPVEY